MVHRSRTSRGRWPAAGHGRVSVVFANLNGHPFGRSAASRIHVQGHGHPLRQRTEHIEHCFRGRILKTAFPSQCKSLLSGEGPRRPFAMTMATTTQPSRSSPPNRFGAPRHPRLSRPRPRRSAPPSRYGPPIHSFKGPRAPSPRRYCLCCVVAVVVVVVCSCCSPTITRSSGPSAITMASERRTVLRHYQEPRACLGTE